MAIVEVSIIPLGLQGTSMSAHVTKVIRVLQGSTLHYELTAMGTIISGDLDEIWSVLRQMHESCFSPEVSRILTQIRIDDRRDRVGSPEQKVKSVLEKLSSQESV